MSAQIPDTLLVSEILKPTGFDCPAKLQGKTFVEATAGDVPSVLEDNKEVSITSNGTVEITPTAGHDYEGMKKVTATVNVAAADIEANKAATIDVSTYTEPVEITPTEGKDGMAKATVLLTNIPSGQQTAYAWKVSASGTNIEYRYYNFATSPADKTEFNSKKVVRFYNDTDGLKYLEIETNGADSYTKTSDTVFDIESDGDELTCTRDSTKDITLW